MPNVLRQFHKPTIAPPDPPEQERVIHCELIHTLHLSEPMDPHLELYLRSEVLHSFTPKELTSWVGEPEPAHPLPDSITVGLTHAF